MLLLTILLCFLWNSHTDKVSDTYDVRIQDHLSNLNASKRWFPYLMYPVYTVINSTQLSVSHDYKRMFIKTHGLMKWCVPREQENQSIYHLGDHTPCGYMLIRSEIEDYDTSWYMKVPSTLSIQLFFVLFEMDLSRLNCEHSALLLAYYAYLDSEWILPEEWTFCGHRRSWYETAPSHSVGLLLRQVNVRQRCNVTFIYTSLESEVADVYIMHTKIDKRPHVFFNHPVSLEEDNYMEPLVHNWRISVDYGFRLHFTRLAMCCSSSVLTIHDGFREQFALRYENIIEGGNFDTKLDLYSKYFQMELQLHVHRLEYSVHRENILKTTYTRSVLQASAVSVDSVTTMANAGSVMYAAYSVAPTTNRVYPNVSFVIRKFEGTSEGNCAFGGFLLTQAISASVSHIQYQLGPFCSKAIPVDPFVGTHGHKSIVLGKNEIYIILYAFGPLYNIDIDLVILSSVCEGIFELPYLCLSNTQDKQKKSYNNADNYEARCILKEHFHKGMVVTFSIPKLSNCVVLQGISYSAVTEERYQIFTTVNLEANIIRSPPFIPLGILHGTSRVLLTIMSLNAKPYSSYINKSLHRKFNGAAIMHFKVLNANLSQQVNFIIRIDTINQDHTCADASYSKEIVKKERGKFYQKLHLINPCGVSLLKLPGTFFIIFYIRNAMATNKTALATKVRSYVFYIVVSRIHCVKDLYDNRDKLTLIHISEGVAHTIDFIANTVEFELHTSFQLILEKSLLCTDFDFKYRVQTVQTQCEFTGTSAIPVIQVIIPIIR